MHSSRQYTRTSGRKATFFALAFLLLALFAASAFAADLALIDVNAAKGTASRYVILDARPKGDWQAGHIPGAIPFSWDSFTRTDARGVKYSSLPPQELAATLSRLGIDEKTPLLIYGDADQSWGGEGYASWLFSWLGHKGPIRLLKGGIQAWQGHNLPLAKGAEKPLPGKARYHVDLKPQYIVSTEDVQRNNGGFTLIDTRSTLEWIRGKIPGAIHIPWDDFYTGKDRHPLSREELKRLLAKHGVDSGKPVVFYCLGGVRSAYAWTAYQLAGLPDGRNYKGSWAAWEKRSGQ
ncbi:sulfurtransferase [Geomesophilobacter sediminis]|uniref:Sulfurtransferase n=1 Tax=Geomesophilobacter sediminis TaxID=2798584 RepID=A0A8J7LYI7_9BACT|nr:rhodanese-like domain-containing protein [Geomesophilobacter sediminis]MBJ6725146.1 sulfurtransferase [Geomesophilobacter sediminis]